MQGVMTFLESILATSMHILLHLFILHKEFYLQEFLANIQRDVKIITVVLFVIVRTCKQLKYTLKIREVYYRISNANIK